MVSQSPVTTAVPFLEFAVGLGLQEALLGLALELLVQVAQLGLEDGDGGLEGGDGDGAGALVALQLLQLRLQLLQTPRAVSGGTARHRSHQAQRTTQETKQHKGLKRGSPENYAMAES